MMKRKQSFWYKCAALVMASSMLFACGGSDDNGDSSGDGYGAATPTPEPTPDPTPDPTPEPTPAPTSTVSKAATNIGDTFVVEGSVTVLVPGAEEGSFETAEQDRDGLTLYVFDNDPAGSSACTSTNCVTTWPPLLATENDEAELPLTIIERDDGNRQWALRDKPLYFFIGDSEAGDITGEGVGDVWHVALSQPTSFNDSDVSESDGDFFVAYGEVPVGLPESEGVNNSFVESRLDKTGFALYTFDVDPLGQSNCFGACLVNWPPLLADENDEAVAPYSLIERQMDENGGTALQWALQGKPLYFFAGDQEVGQTNGKVIDNWRLARPAPWKVADSGIGSILTAAGLVESAEPNSSDEEETQSIAKDGFTLYTFDNDPEGESSCTGGCLTAWPALMANEGAEATAPYSLIERSTGELQWALNGKPLYFFSGDTSAGDTNGDQPEGTWHAARIPPVVISVFGEGDSEVPAFIAHGNVIDEDGEAFDQFQDFTVYIFTEDTDGASTCFGGCAATWPPLFADEDAQDFGDFTIIVRDDPSTTDDDNLNIRQWSYKGQPLYFFVGDTQVGDTNGVYGTWFLAEP